MKAFNLGNILFILMLFCGLYSASALLNVLAYVKLPLPTIVAIKPLQVRLSCIAQPSPVRWAGL